jgi:L,D-peptidoglycan transpeptidase YkuD (ErfK/YbiS/YcfS/YnhG family)
LRSPLFPGHLLWGAVCMLGVLLVGCEDPPLSSARLARTAVEIANGAGAIKYATANYRAAEGLLQKGLLEMARQKGRLAPLRDYRAADSIFQLTIKTAKDAASEAQTYRREQRARAQAERQAVQGELTAWRRSLDGSLTIYKAERHWSQAALALEMSERLIAAEDFTASIEAVAKARESLNQLSQVLDEYASDESQKKNAWRRWVQETIGESQAHGSSAIVVDKAAHKLYLVEAGKLIRTFDCDLGYNSARQKYFAGDGATPEGKYRVTKARHNGSKYYKALLVNYPNDGDKKRFAENKARGVISRWANIGGLIEIHGDGGRNKDWTDGCVALTNDDMDRLMRHVGVGTPVTIVRRSVNWP